jgi:hypothetical protein
MAMPASGSIAIIDNTLQVCSSIRTSVGLACGSLCALSVAAGKTAPHAMSEFYGYTPPVWSCIDVGCVPITEVGIIGSSALVARTLCISTTPTMSVGNCYTLTLSANLCAMGQAVGSYSIMRVTRNNVQIFCCCTSNGCLTPSSNFIVDYNDAICVCLCAYAAGVAAGNVGSCVIISAVTPIVGYECLGSTCASCYIYSS